MTKRSRTILFSILAVLFLTATPSIALYSWGYRIDFDSKRIVQTGAFYFKVFPRSSQIYLDGKSAKKTDFFFGAALVENLLPGKYEVEIKKEGFYSWKKTLEIKEAGVTDAKNIVLVPQAPAFSNLAKNVAAVFFSPDGKKAVLMEAGNNSWALKLLEMEKNVKSHLLESKDVAIAGASLSDLKFSPDSKKILLKAGLRYFLVNPEKSPAELLSLDFAGKNIQDVLFYPGNDQKLFILKNGGMLEADLVKKKVSQVILENVKALRIFDKDAYYLQTSGFLSKTGFSFSGGTKINQSPLSINEKEEYEIYVFSDKIFLQDGQNLHLFNSDSGSFEKFFETGREPEISPDSKKLLYCSEYEIWLLYLKEEVSQPQKPAGEKEFLGRFSEKIGDVFWLTSHYSVFSSGNKIKIAEIDDRDKINIVEWNPPADNAEDLKAFFNQTDKKLYILNGGSLYSSERLLP